MVGFRIGIGTFVALESVANDELECRDFFVAQRFEFLAPPSRMEERPKE
jgi:hypothetical protein